MSARPGLAPRVATPAWPAGVKVRAQCGVDVRIGNVLESRHDRHGWDLFCALEEARPPTLSEQFFAANAPPMPDMPDTPDPDPVHE